MNQSPGNPQAFSQEMELMYWESHLEQWQLHLPHYRRVFPLETIDYSVTSILDVGSGPVSVFEAVAPKQADVTPYDTLAMEYNRLESAKRFPITASIPSRKYNLITLFNMLDHMDEPDDLLDVLVGHLAADGRLWIFVHLDRPFSPAEHPQCFRFWSLPRLIAPRFDIEFCGIQTEGKLYPYAFYAICKARSAQPQSALGHIFKLGTRYAHLHARRAVVAIARWTHTLPLLPSTLRP